LVAAIATEVRLAGEVSLPPIFSDHMVFQRAEHVAVWGWADPGEVVRVTVARQSAQTTTPDSGRWTVDLALMTSERGPHVMIAEGRNRLEVKDVLIGEVWMTAGQSNMELPLQQCTRSAEEIRGANFPEIRLFRGPHAPARQPQSKREGHWVVAAPATVAGFSAVGYYFAKALYAELKIPIGIVDTSVGGTPVETWISQSAVDAVESLRAGQARFIREVDSYPDRMRQFGIEFGNWLKALEREDKPAADPKVFAEPKVDTTDWRTIRLPAKFAAVGCRMRA